MFNGVTATHASGGTDHEPLLIQWRDAPAHQLVSSRFPPEDMTITWIKDLLNSGLSALLEGKDELTQLINVRAANRR